MPHKGAGLRDQRNSALVGICKYESKLLVTSKTLQPSDSNAKPYPESESTSPEQTGKVAEAVATYAVHWEPKPKTPARTIAGITADDAVWAFVKANTLLSHLETAIQLVRETFPNFQKISLRFAPDPEIPFFDAIVIDIKVEATMEKMLEMHNAFLRNSRKSMPSEIRHKIILIPNFV
jgi:hypothetical protein